MAQHTITTTQAYEIDINWINAGWPVDGLRLVSHRVSGNGHQTLLEVPGRDDAPTYRYYDGAYRHIAGPTLAQWYAEQDYADERETMRDLRAGAVQ